MDGGVEEPLAPPLEVLAIAGMLLDVGDQAGMEHALPVVRSIKAAIQLAIGPSAVHPDLLRHLFQRLEALRPQHPVGLLDGRHGDRCEHGARMVDDRHALLALLVFVPREAHAIVPFWATVLVPAPGRTRLSRCYSTARCRPLAPNACQRDPSSAHLAKTL